jgi:Subtilase family.
MKSSRNLLLGIAGIMTFLLASLPAATAPSQIQRPQFPDTSKGYVKVRGLEPKAKLSPELVILFEQFAITRGSRPHQYIFSNEQLKELFNIDGSQTSVDVTIRAGSLFSIDDLTKHRAKIYLRADNMILANVPIRSLERLAGEKFVQSITATKAAQAPPAPTPVELPSFKELESSSARRLRGRLRRDPANSPSGMDGETLTGKGVIIGVIDTGIDWRHEDFIKPDGASRILYLWDMTDNSFADSKGKIGTQPPIIKDGGSPGPGTLYTNKQITDALQGRDTVNSTDIFGHGTSTAGTAASNGRATTNSIPAGTYKGVAPEADLIIVKAGDCGSFEATYILGTHWIAQVAKQRRQPVVINHSLGGHFSAHDGSEPAERVMDELSGAGKPGIAITVSAGNEGRYSLHGSGRFGPRRKGQADIEGSQLIVSVSPQKTNQHTWLNGYFDSRDDWGLVVRGSGNFLVDQIGRPFNLFIYKIGDAVRVQLQQGVKEPDYFGELSNLILDNTRLAQSGEKTDVLWLPLPPGNYAIWGFGPTANVINGSFDLYIPFYTQGSFTLGAEKRRMVGSPGNAANVITVGSYDFRAAWENQQGVQTIYNLPLENISDYSNPGGRRIDGVFKPDIAAPARFTISSMSADANPDSPTCGGSNMGATAGWTSVTRDGKHMAWSGTSAAAPYTAGVIALMFQKNPALDAAQIKDILIKTASRGDRFVGTVPNAEWGYGRLNISAALAETPTPNRTAPRSNKQRTLR